MRSCTTKTPQESGLACLADPLGVLDKFQQRTVEPVVGTFMPPGQNPAGHCAARAATVGTAGGSPFSSSRPLTFQFRVV